MNKYRPEGENRHGVNCRPIHFWVIAVGQGRRNRLSRKHHLKWRVGVCSRTNAAEGEASFFTFSRRGDNVGKTMCGKSALLTSLCSLNSVGRNCALYARSFTVVGPCNTTLWEIWVTILYYLSLFPSCCSCIASQIILFDGNSWMEGSCFSSWMPQEL